MSRSIEDIQADIGDLLQAANVIMAHLENAECCETEGDLVDNLESAAFEMGHLKLMMKTFINRAKRAKRCSDEGSE